MIVVLVTYAAAPAGVIEEAFGPITVRDDFSHWDEVKEFARAWSDERGPWISATVHLVTPLPGKAGGV